MMNKLNKLCGFEKTLLKILQDNPEIVKGLTKWEDEEKIYTPLGYILKSELEVKL